jgi:hypothetical protein
MTISGHRVRDWTYRDARRRMVQVGRARLREHVGVASLDDVGNRLVRCACGWRGNGPGWMGHLDTVVRSAVDADTQP